MDYNNIPKGLKLTTQIPLDVKTYVADEATLAYLGTGNNLAYTYYDGLKVFCIDERTNYEWREVQIGEENTGLVPLDFTYPSGLIAFGINYSNKKYNFFPFVFTGPPGTNGLNSVMALEINQCITYSQALVGEEFIATLYAPVYNLGWKIGTRVKVFTNGAHYLEGIVSSLITNPVSSITINVDLVVGTGELCDTANIVIAGNPGADGVDGTSDNLQRVVSTFTGGEYVLTNADNNYTLIISNGATPVSIKIPTGLTTKFAVALIQKGTGNVTITSALGVTLNTPIDSAFKIKGENYFAYLEQEGNTNTYYLGGNIKI